MNNQEVAAKFIISTLEERCSEYLEMVSDPREFLMGVMANKIIELSNKIDYLERILDHNKINC